MINHAQTQLTVYQIGGIQAKNQHPWLLIGHVGIARLFRDDYRLYCPACARSFTIAKVQACSSKKTQAYLVWLGRAEQVLQYT